MYVNFAEYITQYIISIYFLFDMVLSHLKAFNNVYISKSAARQVFQSCFSYYLDHSCD